jgi:hypothetical protein
MVTTALILFVLIILCQTGRSVYGYALYKASWWLLRTARAGRGYWFNSGRYGVLIKSINMNRIEEKRAGNRTVAAIASDIPIDHVVDELSTIKGLHTIDRLN